MFTAGAGAALMLVPAVHAGLTGAHAAGRPFLYGAVVFGVLIGLVGMSLATRTAARSARSLLLSLVVTYLALPAMLAAPLYEAVPDLDFVSAWLEMVSSLTTTGATVFDRPGRLPDSLHLWRALVGWYGGFIMWVAAIAVLAPQRLGGFELLLTDAQVGRDGTLDRTRVAAFPSRRVWRFARALAPVYGGLTLGVWLLLLFVGEDPLVAACHAMSVLASSGISPVAGLQASAAGTWGEAVLLAAMVFALSRTTFARDMPRPVGRRWWQDAELRMAGAILLAAPTVIYLNHWVGRIDMGTAGPDPWRSLWGAVFTTTSFLTTTGFVSAEWDVARNWSGLTTPGLILIGLAMIGGGVATTAGGVKLLRVYVLYRHGQFEAARLVHPRIVSSPGHRARRFRMEAAFVAWLSFMLFAVAFAGGMLTLAALGQPFEAAMILTTAALTNTGPLVAVAGATPISVGTLDGAVQTVLALAMVLGRLETLAIVALLNPDFWRA